MARAMQRAASWKQSGGSGVRNWQMARRQPLTFEGVVTPERIFLAFVCALALSAIGVLVWHMLSELSWQPQHQFMISIAMPANATTQSGSATSQAGRS